YAQAEKLIKEWKYAEAIPLLEKVVKAEPKNADAYNQLGYAHRKLNKLPEVLRCRLKRTLTIQRFSVAQRRILISGWIIPT
ncbi:MAG: hypothetical protein EBS66_19390, partial [Betaproteobacteria bacterium]|nr:hypothetical protein [Betaproteobacteria bacterium]